MESMHNKVIYGTDFGVITSPEITDCCVHCLCTRGKVSFRYFDNEIVLSENRMAVISYPGHISGIEADDGFECEYIIAPSSFLHGLLPANNYSLPGSVSLTNNPVMDMTDDDMRRMHEDLSAIRNRIANTSHLFYREMIGSLGSADCISANRLQN